MPPEDPTPGNKRSPNSSGRDPTEHRERSSTVKRERAGLLWRLLSPAVRRRAASLLEYSELVELNNAYLSYRSRDRAMRLRIELSLRSALRPTHSVWPTIAALLLGVLGCALFGLHVARIPGMDAVTRLSVFIPLLIGTLAPLALYLVPKYRLNELFGAFLTSEAIAAVFLCFLGIIWMLFFIGEGQQSFGRRPGGLTLIVLCLGAVTAPLLEEVFFRELIPSLFGPPPHVVGHAVGAALFALAHLPSGIALFGQYLVAGLFLATSRVYSGGILYPFLIHATANLIHQTLF